MLNLSIHRVGGIRFIRLGRISLSINVQSPARYLEWLEAKAEAEAFRALAGEFA